MCEQDISRLVVLAFSSNVCYFDVISLVDFNSARSRESRIEIDAVKGTWQWRARNGKTFIRKIGGDCNTNVSSNEPIGVFDRMNATQLDLMVATACSITRNANSFSPFD